MLLPVSKLIFLTSLLNISIISFRLVVSKEKWEKMMKDNNWNNVELRDNRYNQIVHMVSAANGAEDFYSVEVSTYVLLFCLAFLIQGGKCFLVFHN